MTNTVHKIDIREEEPCIQRIKKTIQSHLSRGDLQHLLSNGLNGDLTKRVALLFFVEDLTSFEIAISLERSERVIHSSIRRSTLILLRSLDRLR